MGPGRKADRAVHARAAGVLDRVAVDARSSGWTPDALAEAHRAVRLVAAVLTGQEVRQTRLTPAQAVPEGRLLLPRRFRAGVAATSAATAASVDVALGGVPPDSPPAARLRLERLGDAMEVLTRTQYGEAASAVDSSIDEAIAAVRDLAREAARERLWSLREWRRRASSRLPKGDR
jgi:hypothetical protein